MHQDFPDIILQATGATDLVLTEIIQELWSGYGTIRRYRLEGGDHRHVVVKHVRLVEPAGHPRGWNGDLGHRRKLQSYKVEQSWYREWASQCDEKSRVPRCLAYASRGEEALLVLEDLDDSGFPGRLEQVSSGEIEACLHWLANFHATFLGCHPTDLWEQGTYWHLATRPEELAALTDLSLRQAAAAIDRRLEAGRFQTLVHGDAKLANFCFSPDGKQVAAVDFQYVGGGCGMKDVAYFIGSCLNEDECEQWVPSLLDIYFDALRAAVKSRHPVIDERALVEEWHALFLFAWADFHRFLKGWCPGHWKINSYSEQVARSVVKLLKQG